MKWTLRLLALASTTACNHCWHRQGVPHEIFSRIAHGRVGSSCNDSCRAVAACRPTAPTAPPRASLDGTWEGKMNDLPAIELKIDNSTGKISGTMLFYFQERSDPSEPWHVTGGKPAPLLLPHVEGNILTFELQHHKCHNCAELGPNQKFRVELKEPNEARLWMWENQDAPKDRAPV